MPELYHFYDNYTEKPDNSQIQLPDTKMGNFKAIWMNKYKEP